MDEASPPLDGEHIETNDWEDARHWMSIYGDLLEFKRGILNRIRRDLSKLPPEARRAAETDFTMIEGQMVRYQKRLELWHQRLQDLNGPWLDPNGRLIRYKDRELTLTLREFQLLKFLLDHPYRFFTVSQILGQAWAEPTLFPEQVRVYIKRVRAAVAAMEIPCDIVNRPGRGYSLEFRGER
jgi:DNA-binding response OmpR family regulator